jgi:hypothetical protein
VIITYPLKLVRTEICKEIFKGLDFKSSRRKFASLVPNWAADILRGQFQARGLSERAAADLLGIRAREFRGYRMGERVPDVVKFAMLNLLNIHNQR